MNQLPVAVNAGARRNWLYRIGAAAALVVFVLFSIGIAGTVSAGLQPIRTSGRFIAFPDNWLVLLFKLNAGFSGVHSDSLQVLSLLDISIMALLGTAFLAL